MKAENVGQFELYKRLQEAVKTGRYMVAITHFDNKEQKMHHYTMTNNFPKEDIINSLGQHALNMQNEVAVNE